jgi:RNA polymerase sigma-70 factor (ECF subfamily)
MTPANLMALLQEHEAHLTHYAARLLGGDVERARDVVQEAFLRLWRAGEGETGGNPVAWLFTVCRNLSFDVLRKEKRMISLRSDDFPADSGPGAETAHAALEAREGMIAALAALGSLPANQQEVIRLKFQNGLSYKDIAAVTGLSVTNVGFLIHTGLKALRQALAPAEVKTGVKGGAK